MTQAWILLILAGLFETGWAIGLKYTHGFTRVWPTVWTAVALLISMVLLARAVRDLPIGTAYAVWVGIGALGAAVLGIVLFHESASPGRLFFLALLLVSIVGLKWTSPQGQPALTPDLGLPVVEAEN
jgi:quaternary ammonium compound-resistance protein SugE